MNVEQVEALFFRWDALFPAAKAQSTAERRARIAEWFDSDLVDVDYELAREAFRDWKLAHDWPPSLHEFREQVVETRRRLRPAIGPADAEPEDEPVGREEALRQIERLRVELATASRRVPEDNRPTRRLANGALVYEPEQR